MPVSPPVFRGRRELRSHVGIGPWLLHKVRALASVHYRAGAAKVVHAGPHVRCLASQDSSGVLSGSWYPRVESLDTLRTQSLDLCVQSLYSDPTPCTSWPRHDGGVKSDFLVFCLVYSVGRFHMDWPVLASACSTRSSLSTPSVTVIHGSSNYYSWVLCRCG